MKPKQKESISAFSIFKRAQAIKKKKELEKLRKRQELPSRGSPATQQEVPAIPSTSRNTPSVVRSSLNASKRSSRGSTTPGAKRRRISVGNRDVPCGNPHAANVFEWLISPSNDTEFFEHVWEKKPYHIRRSSTHYQGLFSCAEFSRMLEKEHLDFEKDINVVKYEDGNKIVNESDGRAYGPLVWNFFENGWSLQMPHPQRYNKAIWKLCVLLQEYFGSFTGANIYLTPANSQGFAPHYDDIEAFVLQIEGRKQWKIYEPRKDQETLPRFSSGNFDQNEIGDPIMEVELQPGDLLYFPRGFIHQAKTPESHHSLHITVSTYMKNTYGDLLKKILDDAIECAMQNDVRYRESLPKDYLNINGPHRDAVFDKVSSLASNLFEHINIDHGINLMAKEFIHSSLPPCIDEHERSCSIHGNGERWENGKVCNGVCMELDTEIRWIRKRAVRLVRENHKALLYHSLENSRSYREKDAQYLEINWEHTRALEQLFEMHPRYIRVADLDLVDDEAKLDIACMLYDKGVIQSKVPMKAEDESEN